MNTHSKSNLLLALVLAISIAATGCSAQWINIAAVFPALQKQVSDDFKAHWEQDCSLVFLPKGLPLVLSGGRS